MDAGDTWSRIPNTSTSTRPATATGARQGRCGQPAPEPVEAERHGDEGEERDEHDDAVPRADLAEAGAGHQEREAADRREQHGDDGEDAERPEQCTRRGALVRLASARIVVVRSRVVASPAATGEQQSQEHREETERADDAEVLALLARHR